MPGYVEPILAPVAHELVDRLSARGEADLVAEFTKQFPFTVITRLLGIPERNEGDIQRWALALLSFPWDPEGALAASRDFTDYLTPIVAERREAPGDDLISTLATTEVDGERLTDDEIFSFIRVLFPAGADTTYLGLGTLMYALMTHPEAMDRVRRDPESRRAAIEEALRWEPPVSVMPRFAPVDTDEFGTPIRGGNQILFGVAAANRDPDQFPEPDRYDLDRDPSMSLTFGIGMHFCVGAHLARAELATALDVVPRTPRRPRARSRRADPVRRLGAPRSRHPPGDLHRHLSPPARWGAAHDRFFGARSTWILAVPLIAVP